jgi:hypothetical protein
MAGKSQFGGKSANQESNVSQGMTDRERESISVLFKIMMADQAHSMKS